MGLGGHAWALRRRLIGPKRVVTGEQVAALGRARTLGLRGRARTRALHLRELTAGPPSSARIHVGEVLLELGGGEDFPIDWKAFVEIFADEPYAEDYRETHVLDVGAHKGYFAAYALALGAARVVSFEPAIANFEVLARTAAGAGGKWLARNAALGRASGTGELLLDTTSWAHSLVRVERPAGTQPVSIVTLADALAELRAPPGACTIVKVDAEGAECEILEDAAALGRVDVLLVEWHAETATCTAEELTQAVQSAALELQPPTRGAMRFRRP